MRNLYNIYVYLYAKDIIYENKNIEELLNYSLNFGHSKIREKKELFSSTFCENIKILTHLQL